MTDTLPKLLVRLDDQGRPVRETEVSEGVYAISVDTARVRALNGDDLQLADTRRLRRPDWADRGSTATPQPKSLRRQNGLDYLRQLSEEIKARRQKS